MPLATEDQVQAVIAEFDRVNERDPHSEPDGTPKELAYAQRMSDELAHFAPDAGPLLRLAARAQHIERWIIPREDYPMDRTGYKRWRTELGKHHAQRAAGIMAEHGFDEDDCQTVADMLQKKRLKRDEDVQALEDVICLVFIKYYLEDFARKHSDDKLIHIIRKTWKKMSARGHEAALGIEMPEHLGALVGKALKG